MRSLWPPAHGLEAGQAYGVTDVLGVISKPLAAWAARKTTTAWENALRKEIGGTIITEGSIARLKEAVGRPAYSESSTAMHDGTGAHAWMEDQVNVRLGKAAKGVVAPAPLVVEAWTRWMADHHVQPIATELLVWHPTERYTGHIDLVAMVDGWPTVIDYKYAKDCYQEYFLQVTAYAHALQQCYIEAGVSLPIQDIRAGILLLPKEGRATYQYHPVEPLKEGDYWQAFRAAKTLHTILEKHKPPYRSKKAVATVSVL